MAEQTISKQIRTRIAPSPTGYPHIGTIYQALFDFAFAKKHNGSFLIRIEDTDRERFVEDAEEKIYDAIDWFNLMENESPRKSGTFAPYRQSERLEIYKSQALQLIENGHAYYCFCTKERLETHREKLQKEKKPLLYDKHCLSLTKEHILEKLAANESYVIRLNVPKNQTIVCKDEIRGEISFDANLVDDQVLLKSDGFPTYHLAAIVDDHIMEISHVVRGEEWLPSFPKHVLLYRYFGWHMPLFFHTSALRNPDKSKLSKRQGHTNVSWYKEEGYLPQAILNFLALLGWSHPEEKEIFSLEEFIDRFDLKDIKPIGPIFDLTKLTWMNGVYIREVLSSQELLDILYTFDPTLREIPEEIVKKLIEVAKTRIKTLREFKEMITPFLYPQQTVRSDEHRDIMKTLYNELNTLSEWNKDTIATVLLEKFIRTKKINFKQLYLLLLGTDKGLPLADTFEILGKEKTLRLIMNE